MQFLGWVRDALPQTTVTPAGESRVISLGWVAWKITSHVRENHVDSAWPLSTNLDKGMTFAGLFLASSSSFRHYLAQF